MRHTIPTIGLLDVIVTFFFLLLIYIWAIYYRDKRNKTNPEYKYFIICLTAKLVGGVGFVLYMLYYAGGDSIVFFNAGKALSEYYFTDFSSAIDVLFGTASELNLDQYNFAPIYNYILRSNDVLTIVKITSIINILSVGSYLGSSILFAFLSFLGLWFGYSNLCELYPKSAKKMMIAFFLIPTALLWSSGVLKDTVTMCIIGLYLYAFSNPFPLI